jgi:SAM-dependent methyltransferase
VKPEEFNFVDVGSGRGRVALLAAEQPFRKVIGVELDPKLHAISLRNLEIRQRAGALAAPVELVCDDAVRFAPRLPAGDLVCFFYHPFGLDGSSMLRTCLRELAKVTCDGRRVRIGYVGASLSHAPFGGWNAYVPTFTPFYAPRQFRLFGLRPQVEADEILAGLPGKPPAGRLARTVWDAVPARAREADPATTALALNELVSDRTFFRRAVAADAFAPDSSLRKWGTWLSSSDDLPALNQLVIREALPTLLRPTLSAPLAVFGD